MRLVVIGEIMQNAGFSSQDVANLAPPRCTNFALGKWRCCQLGMHSVVGSIADFSIILTFPLSQPQSRRPHGGAPKMVSYSSFRLLGSACRPL